MSNELKLNLPSATAVRKGGATAAAPQCEEEDVRIVTRQLAHDPRVHAQYYEGMVVNLTHISSLFMKS